MNPIDMLQVIEAQSKLIKELTLENLRLTQRVEQREYNRRFTNVKHIKKPSIPKLDGTQPATINLSALRRAKKVG